MFLIPIWLITLVFFEEGFSMLPFVVETVAEAIWSCLDEAVAAKGWASLAIPGGRTPGPILQHLSSICEPRLRANLHLWWLDERAVPVGDSQRNDLATLAA